MSNVSSKLFSEIIDSSVEAMKEYLKKSKEELPLIFKLILKDGQIVDIPSFLYDRFPTKQIIAKFIQRACQDLKPVAVMQICECWYVVKNTRKEFEDSQKEHKSVREMPESVEGFMINLSYSKNNKGLSMMYMAPIIKDKDGNRFLDESRSSKNEHESSEGTFCFSPELLTEVEA